MANTIMARAYVEKTLSEYLETDNLRVDDDGDVLIRSGSTLCVVRVTDGPTGPMMRVFAPFLSKVEKMPELLDHLNEMNANCPYVRFFWSNQTVFCGVDVLAEDLQASEVGNALSAVSWHADKFDDELASKFGGDVCFPDDENETASSDQPKPAYTGQYL